MAADLDPIEPPPECIKVDNQWHATAPPFAGFPGRRQVMAGETWATECARNREMLVENGSRPEQPTCEKCREHLLAIDAVRRLGGEDAAWRLSYRAR